MSYTPKTFGMVLNRFFEILRGHWKMLIGVGLIPAAGLALFMVAIIGFIFWKFAPQFGQASPNLDPTMVLWIFYIILPLYPVVIFVMSLYLAAIATATTRINRGEEVTIGSAWHQAFSHVGRYFWLIVRQIIVVVLPIFAVMTIIVGGAAGLIALLNRGHGDGSSFVLLFPLIFLCYLGLMVYSIWMAVRFSFSFFASVSEDLTAAQAMARSWQLTRDAFWRIFGVMFVVYLMIYAAQMVVTFAIEFVVIIAVFGAIALGVTPQSTVFPFLVGIGAIVAIAFFALLYSVTYATLSTALSILYEDQRMRLTPSTDTASIPPPIYNGASTA
jgi:hypothetical protein